MELPMSLARLSQKTVRTLAARLAADGANPFCPTTERGLHDAWASGSARPLVVVRGSAAYAAPAIERPRPTFDVRV